MFPDYNTIALVEHHEACEVTMFSPDSSSFAIALCLYFLSLLPCTSSSPFRPRDLVCRLLLQNCQLVSCRRVQSIFSSNLWECRRNAICSEVTTLLYAHGRFSIGGQTNHCIRATCIGELGSSINRRSALWYSHNGSPRRDASSSDQCETF